MKVAVLKWPLELLSCHLRTTWAGYSLCAYYCSSPAAVWRAASPQTSCVCINNVSCGHLSYLHPCPVYLYHVSSPRRYFRWTGTKRGQYSTFSPSLLLSDTDEAEFSAQSSQPCSGPHSTTHIYPNILSDMKEFVLMKPVIIKLDNRPDEQHSVNMCSFVFI